MLHKITSYREASDEVKHITSLGGVVAGGYALHLSQEFRQPFKDIDIFVPDRDTWKAVFLYLNGIANVSNERTNDTIFTQDTPFETIVYNLIKPDTFRSFTDVESLITQFDLRPTQIAYTAEGLVCTPYFYAYRQSDLAEIDPAYTIKDPIGTLHRLTRYAAKGYMISKSDIKRCLVAWEESAKVVAWDGSDYV